MVRRFRIEGPHRDGDGDATVYASDATDAIRQWCEWECVSALPVGFTVREIRRAAQPEGSR